MGWYIFAAKSLYHSADPMAAMVAKAAMFVLELFQELFQKVQI